MADKVKPTDIDIEKYRACEDYLHEDTDPLTSSASAVAYA